MATNVDFDNLILRIDAATDTLEVAVSTINNSVGDMEDAVLEAQGYASAASNSAGQAALAVTAAQSAANAASNSANTASNAVSTVEGLIEDLEEAVILEEAPIDNKQYARINASWQEVVASGGGEGTVTSINNITPDEEGNVTLSAEDVGALPDSYTPDWTDIDNKPSFSTVATTGDYDDLTNKPSIPTQGITSIVAGDNITVDNTNPLQPVISASGGGGSSGNFPGYPITGITNIYYGNNLTFPPPAGALLDSYPFENPNEALDARRIWYDTGSALISFQTALTTANFDMTPFVTTLGKLNPTILTGQMTLPGGKAAQYFDIRFRQGAAGRFLIEARMTTSSDSNWQDADLPELGKVWIWQHLGATRGFKLVIPA